MNDLITDTNGAARLRGRWTTDEGDRPVLRWYLDADDCPTTTADVELAA